MANESVCSVGMHHIACCTRIIQPQEGVGGGGRVVRRTSVEETGHQVGCGALVRRASCRRGQTTRARLGNRGSRFLGTHSYPFFSRLEDQAFATFAAACLHSPLQPQPNALKSQACAPPRPRPRVLVLFACATIASKSTTCVPQSFCDNGRKNTNASL